MQKKSVILVALGSAVCAVLVYQTLHRPAKRHTAPRISAEQSAAAPADGGATREQLSALQARVTDLQRQLDARAVVAVASALPAPPPIGEIAPDHAAEQRRLEEQMQQVATEFEAEPRDNNWARDRTAEFEASVARGNLLKGALQSLECRSSMCRVEMLDDRSPTFFNQLNEMISSVGAQLPSMAGERKKRPDGTAVAVYYFSKDS